MVIVSKGLANTTRTDLWFIAFCVFAYWGATPRVEATEPCDPQLIPEAREVLRYLDSIYGKQTLLGQNKVNEAQEVKAATGKFPALISLDLSGWQDEKWNDGYRRTIDAAMSELAGLWHDQGCLVSVEFHWGNPLGESGSFEASKLKFMPADLKKMTTPGTPEYAKTRRDLQRHADFLDNLTKARVPVLWRPLHEIDGGWFWWTDREHPENTAALWRMMYDYLVHEREMHNLIWVYSAALAAGPETEDTAAIERRKQFYPGSGYVDIAGIDIYVSEWYGWRNYREDAYQKAFDVMQQVAPGKMLALCECEGIPNPQIVRQDGPKWLYCLPWYVGNRGWNPPDWVEQCYADDVYLSLEDLPTWKGQP